MWIRLFLLIQLIFSAFAAPFSPPSAPHLESGYDVVNAVNALRATYGLPPYEIDEKLMSIAQAQSNYQASINSLTHKRADGTGAEVVSSENIALGAGQPIDTIIRQQWTKDYWHTVTLIGFSKGVAGAGIATGSDGLVYYTLDVNNTGGKLTGLTINSLPTTTGAAGKITPGAAAATALPINAILTTTPLADGSLYHSVLYGQTLWGISKAYNIQLNDLTSLNQIDPTKPVIQIGQKLLIHPSYTPSPAPSATETPQPPTETASPTSTIQATLTATLKPTPAPLLSPETFKNLNAVQTAGIVLAGLSILGLGLVLISRFLKRK